MLRYHVDEGLPFIGEGDFILAHSANIDARRGGSIAPSTAERPVKRLRTKSRARTPNVLGNAISLSNTTSESREVVADVGGTTVAADPVPIEEMREWTWVGRAGDRCGPDRLMTGW